ncbi:hypothetical protein BCR34DRAFT_584064 [Clohesyomyces aquaticus]|uniref:Uncharacterized protein n=1 Tax=Clohesyomyces aquaticus TaxID=1231657 RepID=A0A1Y2A3Z1_9PLEO|nr:hypothetical protein BCR34DRAFT_584064 [Clohesyomyces aquaticus]
MFALVFSWLSFSHVRVIERIAEAKSGFEVAFETLQFVAALACFQWIHFSITAGRAGQKAFRYLAGVTAAVMDIFGVKLKNVQPYVEYELYLFLASLTLFMRSFCEVIIVGQLDRFPTHLQDIQRARNVTYHLFSAVFAVFAVFSIPSSKATDPLLLEEINAINLVKNSVLDTLAGYTENETKTAPDLSIIFDVVEAAQSEDEVKRELKRVRKLYKDWTPVYKWSGENGDTSSFVPGTSDLGPANNIVDEECSSTSAVIFPFNE